MTSKLTLPLVQGSLQEALDRTLGELPRRALADFLKQKIGEQGIELTEAQLSALTQQALQASSGSVLVEDGNPDKEVIISFTEQDHEAFGRRLDELSDSVPAIAEEFIEKTSADLLALLKQEWPSAARDQQELLDGFRQRMGERWGPGIDGLRLLTTIAREFGNNITHGIDKPDLVAGTLAVLRLLHSRSCQITEEIVALLSGGFADGAMARWRTLHEIAAVAYLIGEHGEDLAERYLVHEIVETRRAARQYQNHAARLGQEPIDDQEMGQIEGQYTSVIDRYGREFGKPQGWAAAHLKKSDPQIADIMEAAKLDHLGPYYRLASHSVHANPKGVLFKLGLLRETEALLAGPSDLGLADPGHAAARSLLQISTTLTGLNPTIDNVITTKMMLQLLDEITENFHMSHESIMVDASRGPPKGL
ncbi:DUF5677 domain-containing protein [Bradyrhizobium sp. URHD0069]|uniref:DUF5677 domain-containing protein n=1 Tax=Bradyrhizobium sp. URHD0069 TaxID=1380355 RepID=UPI00068FE3E7|nr:DUF5677 domain-containing protein [Bradyrhizobium sp. URHD0069]